MSMKALSNWKSMVQLLEAFNFLGLHHVLILLGQEAEWTPPSNNHRAHIELKDQNQPCMESGNAVRLTNGNTKVGHTNEEGGIPSHGFIQYRNPNVTMTLSSEAHTFRPRP